MSSNSNLNNGNHIPNPSKLKISTMTIITNIGAKYPNGIIKVPEIDLDLFSRFAKTYSENDDECEKQEGCIVGIDYYSNLKRGCLRNKIKKKGKEEKPFYNQATIIYNYWGFRSVNVKIFNNGKLQMTGIQSESEAKIMTSYIINQLKNTNVKIYNGISNLPKNGDFNDYIVTYNPRTHKHNYYRWNYFQNHQEEVDILKDERFQTNCWINNTSINDFINQISQLKTNKEHELLIKKDSGISVEEERELEAGIKNLLIKEKKLKKVMEKDSQLLENLIKNHKNEMNYDGDTCDLKYWEFDIISRIPEYYLDNIKIELINSDFITNCTINNTILHKVLTDKYHIFASYEPNDYPGVKSKFYWNKTMVNNHKQGCCLCNPPCASLGKKSVCTQITISIFQSGSIIITGAKSIQQIRDAYKFINKVLADNYMIIKGKNDDTRVGENKANTLRKMLRKKRLFHVKKSDIVNI